MQSVFFSGVVNPSSARIKFVALPLLLGTTSANALVLTPVFDSSITSNANAAKIEGSINSAISAIDKLYGNAVTLAVDFTYTALHQAICSLQPSISVLFHILIM